MGTRFVHVLFDSALQDLLLAKWCCRDCARGPHRTGAFLFRSISMLRRVPGQGPLRVRRDQSGDPLCILRLFIMVIFTLAQKIDKSNPGILAKTKPNSGVSEPPGDVVVAARAGEEGTEMKTESQTRAFWPIGSNRCNAASLPFTGVQQTRVAR